MSARFLITGVGLLAFGLANFFRYLPITHSLLFWNTPFPFEHYTVVDTEGGGTHYLVEYFPLDAAANDPYWLLWSLMLYAGILIIVLEVWRR